MKESLLQAFFNGSASAASLAEGLSDVVGRGELTAGRNLILDLGGEVGVSAGNLVQLCDAHISGDIDSDDLKAVARFIIAAQHFNCDNATPGGELVAQVLHQWSAPEINYPLTGSNITRYRAGLVAGTHPFATSD